MNTITTLILILDTGVRVSTLLFLIGLRYRYVSGFCHQESVACCGSKSDSRTPEASVYQ
jgi:hypothetical protein